MPSLPLARDLAAPAAIGSAKGLDRSTDPSPRSRSRSAGLLPSGRLPALRARAGTTIEFAALPTWGGSSVPGSACATPNSSWLAESYLR